MHGCCIWTNSRRCHSRNCPVFCKPLLIGTLVSYLSMFIYRSLSILVYLPLSILIYPSESIYARTYLEAKLPFLIIPVLTGLYLDIDLQKELKFSRYSPNIVTLPLMPPKSHSAMYELTRARLGTANNSMLEYMVGLFAGWPVLYHHLLKVHAHRISRNQSGIIWTLINKSINQSINQLINQSINRSINRSFNQ